jgi:hypothetical protein
MMMRSQTCHRPIGSFASSPLSGEDGTARFSSFTKIDLAVRGGGDFGPLVPSLGDHPHLTTASLRHAIVVLPPRGGGGENRKGGAGLGGPALRQRGSNGGIKKSQLQKFVRSANIIGLDEAPRVEPLIQPDKR